MLALEHMVTAEEGQDCQTFVEASRAALQTCPPKTHGALMYSLQFLTGNVLLATILGMLTTTLQPAVVGREPTLAASIPSVSEMPAPPTGTKWWCHLSDQGVCTPRLEEEETAELDISPKEKPC